MRGSSVHFRRIASAMHAVSHASREVPPEYLLPEGMSLGTHVVIDDHGQVQKLLEHKMHLASRQAKATKDYSPMWEGVINLPEPSPDLPPTLQVEIVKAWCLEYERMTGHKVIRADVHLDEGFVDEAGKPHYNAHAHVMCDRTDDKGKVKKLTSTVLREVQNMTANVTTLQRGLDARTTRRKHIGHQNFRFDAEKNRLELDKPKADLVRLQKLSKQWSDSDMAKVKDLQAKLDGEPARLDAALKAQEAHLNEKYRLDRVRMKQENADALAAGLAKMYSQKDYQDLKKERDDAVAELNETKEKVEKMEKQITQLETDKAELAATADKWAAKARAYQDAKAQGTPAHLIVPGTTPAPPPSLSNKSDVLTRAPAPMPPVRIRTASEAPKQPEAPIPPPKPQKTLSERLNESMKAMLDWIKSIGGHCVEIDRQRSDNHGPVKYMDGLHCIQKIGGANYIVHQLDHLDKVPALDDPKMEIRYRGGVGQVIGKLGKAVER